MDPITSADRLILLLRQRLQERSRTTRGRTGGKASRGGPAIPDPVGVHALAAIEGVDERQLRRALVQNLLVEQFGPDMMNDARFQQVVTRVTEAIDDDAGAARLLSRALSELRSG